MDVVTQAAIRHILVTTTLTPDSRPAVESATSIARAFGASIDLVHVRPLASHLMSRAADDELLLERIDEALAAEAQEVVDAGVTCVTTSLDGSPPARIVAHAEKTHPDLIVVAQPELGRGLIAALARLTARLLHQVTCPVLVVPA